MDSQLTDWSFEWAGMVQDHAGGVILLQHAIDALQAKATTPVNITLWAVQTESRDWLPVVNGRSNSVQQYSWQMPVDEFKRYGDSLFSSGTVDISEGSGWQSVFSCGDHVQHNHAVTHWLCGKGNAYIGVLALHSERVSNTVSSADTQLVESCLPTLERIVQNPAFSITELQNTLLLQPKSYEQVAEEERLISMGRLVASITHEVNNPLGVAITGVSHFRDASVNDC